MSTKIKPTVKHFLGYSTLLIVCLFVLSSLVSHTPSTLHPAASEPETGQVQISVPIHNAEYVIFDNETNGLIQRHVGGTDSFDLPAGDYRVEFAPVPGHTTPKPSTFSLNAGDAITMDGDYRFNCGGPLLGIKVFPEFARYAIYNIHGQKLIEAEGSQFFTYPAGDYWIEFLELPNYQHPPKQPFRLLNKIVTTVNAVYNKQ
ncbi:hypothetical protein JW752_01015 [Candidatus Peregrinibacteria bacterium]|nr:hypothetical protein [Candidatus Peregrinibacteria bacterium]